MTKKNNRLEQYNPTELERYGPTCIRASSYMQDIIKDTQRLTKSDSINSEFLTVKEYSKKLSKYKYNTGLG